MKKSKIKRKLKVEVDSDPSDVNSVEIDEFTKNEVLAITDDEKEESEDQEESGSEDGDLLNRDAWGKKKSTYYAADFVDQDRGRTYREEDAEAAKVEEEEALAIQKSVYHNINADNLGAHLLFESSEESAEEEEIVNKDAATKEEIIKYMKKKTKFFEYKELCESTFQKLKKVMKLWRLVQTRRIRSRRVEMYVRVKKQILWLIIHNIDMYLLLLSTGKYNMKYHPVVKWIAHFKQLLDDFELKHQIHDSAIDKILEKKEDEIDISSDLEDTDQPKPDREDKDQYKDENEASADENSISYEIGKNKGTVYQKKKCRITKVHYRKKYQKPQIRRKGQVRKVLKEIKRYEGEPTGININVVKSIKFK